MLPRSHIGMTLDDAYSSSWIYAVQDEGHVLRRFGQSFLTASPLGSRSKL